MFKPTCIIFDIDGTVALQGNRDPYDMTRVGEDTVNEPVMRVAKMLRRALRPLAGEIIFTSGRHEAARQQTQMWLDHHFGHTYQLHMRADGDQRPDFLIKKDMLDEIQGNFRILCVFDDRDQVVKMWRDNGIACFQVAPGDF